MDILEALKALYRTSPAVVVAVLLAALVTGIILGYRVLGPALAQR